MNFIKNNSFILSIIALSAILTLIAGLVMGEEEPNKTIVIHQGDTLWTLAEQYKGDLPHEEWIASVMDANDLHHPVITSGSKLVIPSSLMKTDQIAGEIYLAGENH
ncbi:LysM peptidoglycan-binding domain-containing protein [Chungangia koreensis]|uniref:LysM peptidoglycan-binding domain-containing protein n=1 Tax=Chungangia koreensis TaxID=752657 RepID=A0ABV8X7V7_9LACT